MKKEKDEFILDDEIEAAKAEATAEISAEGDVMDEIDDVPVKAAGKKKISKNGIIGAAMLIAGLALIGVFCYFFFAPTSPLNPVNKPENEVVEAPPVNIDVYTHDIDSNMIDLYRSMLLGQFTAQINDETVYFNFNANESYKGYSSKRNEDTGRWELRSDGINATVVIQCKSGAEDVYAFDLDNVGHVLLTTPLGDIYVLEITTPTSASN